MDRAGYLRVLRRYASFLVAGLLAGLLLAGGTAALLPRAYTASSTLFLQVQFTGATLKSRAEFAIERVQSYPALIESPVLLQRVISDLDLPMTTQQLAAQVQAESQADTSLLTVSATADDPRLAARIANDAGKQLIEKVGTLESGQVTSSNSMQLVQTVLAQPPLAPSSPDVPVLLSLGALAGLVGAYLLALLLDALRPGVRTVDEVRQVTGLPVIAQLPRRSVRRRNALALTSAVVTFAANVRAIGRGDVPPLLLLVPVDRRAAGSATRYVLARGLANAGANPVVVEADGSLLPPPAVALPGAAPGIAELLADDCAAVVHRNVIEGVDAVATGDPGAAPAGLRLPGLVARAIDRLREDHTAVVVQATEDSAPLPTGAMAGAGPVALLVVSRGATQLGLRDALTRLRIYGIEPTGVVLLDTPEGRPIELHETWRGDEPALRTPDSTGIDTGELERLIAAAASAREAR